jgi:hypothetical protein
MSAVLRNIHLFHEGISGYLKFTLLIIILTILSTGHTAYHLYPS